MTEQRLLEEMLEGIRALRQSDTDTKVKLEGISVKLESMISMRNEFDAAMRDITDQGLRLEVLEKQRLDHRLKRVESTVFKIVAATLMLIGGLEFVSRLIDFWQRVKL